MAFNGLMVACLREAKKTTRIRRCTPASYVLRSPNLLIIRQFAQSNIMSCSDQMGSEEVFVNYFFTSSSFLGIVCRSYVTFLVLRHLLVLLLPSIYDVALGLLVLSATDDIYLFLPRLLNLIMTSS